MTIAVDLSVCVSVGVHTLSHTHHFTNSCCFIRLRCVCVRESETGSFGLFADRFAFGNQIDDKRNALSRLFFLGRVGALVSANVSASGRIWIKLALAGCVLELHFQPFQIRTYPHCYNIAMLMVWGKFGK